MFWEFGVNASAKSIDSGQPALAQIFAYERIVYFIILWVVGKLIFVAFVEDNVTMSSITYFEDM